MPVHSRCDNIQLECINSSEGCGISAIYQSQLAQTIKARETEGKGQTRSGLSPRVGNSQTIYFKVCEKPSNKIYYCLCIVWLL